MPGGIDEEDNVGVALEYPLHNMRSQEARRRRWECSHHDVDLLLDLREHGLVRDGDALEDMVSSVVDRLCGPDEIDVCEAA